MWQCRLQAADDAHNQPTRSPRGPLGASPQPERHSCPGRPRPHQPHLWQRAKSWGLGSFRPVPHPDHHGYGGSASSSHRGIRPSVAQTTATKQVDGVPRPFRSALCFHISKLQASHSYPSISNQTGPQLTRLLPSFFLPTCYSCNPSLDSILPGLLPPQIPAPAVSSCVPPRCTSLRCHRCRTCTRVSADRPFSPCRLSLGNGRARCVLSVSCLWRGLGSAHVSPSLTRRPR